MKRKPIELSRDRRGFTLVEMMTVITILGILMMTVLPKIASAFRNAHEGANLGKLGSVRSALNIYYADNGFYPSELTPIQTDGNRYLSEFPGNFTDAHGNSETSASYPAYDPAADGGGWGYVNEGPDLGKIWIRCTHADGKGVAWNTR